MFPNQRPGFQSVSPRFKGEIPISDEPGPGDYENKLPKNNGSSIKMNKSPSRNDLFSGENFTPGPGYYKKPIGWIKRSFNAKLG